MLYNLSVFPNTPEHTCFTHLSPSLPIVPVFFTTVDLFIVRLNNKDQDELDTEREIHLHLQSRILMLFFASAACESCQRFAPTLTDFFE